MTTTTTKKELNIMSKMINAMEEMKNPTKDTNAYKYKYATLDQVLSIVKPALFKNKLMLLQRVERDGEQYLLTTSVADENEIMNLDMRPITFSGDAQRDGSLETYYRRYSLMTVFGLAGEDDDGAATKKVESAEPKKETKDKKKDSPELTDAKNYFIRVCQKRGGWEKFIQDVKADEGYAILKDVPDFWRKQADKIAETVEQID